MIGDLIGEWIKGILIDGIMGNLSGLFNTVNTKVGEIASDVGSTPQDWNGGIFSMLQKPVRNGDCPHCGGHSRPCDVL